MNRPTLPDLHTFPEYDDASRRLSRISVELRSVVAEIKELQAKRPALAKDNPAMIDAVIDDKPLPPSQSPMEWANRIQSLQERERLLAEAKRIQLGKVRDARAAAADQIAEDLRSYYTDLQTRMAAAVLELGELADEEAALRIDLQGASIPAGSLNVNPLNCMRLSEGQSAASGFLTKAEKFHGVKVRK